MQRAKEHTASAGSRVRIELWRRRPIFFARRSSYSWVAVFLALETLEVWMETMLSRGDG